MPARRPALRSPGRRAWRLARLAAVLAALPAGAGAQAARPEPPERVTATQSGPREVTVTWPAVAGATTYHVGRHMPPEGWRRLYPSNPAATTYVDRDVRPGRSYAYQIVAVNADGASRPARTELLPVSDAPPPVAGDAGAAGAAAAGGEPVPAGPAAAGSAAPGRAAAGPPAGGTPATGGAGPGGGGGAAGGGGGGGGEGAPGSGGDVWSRVKRRVNDRVEARALSADSAVDARTARGVETLVDKAGRGVDAALDRASGAAAGAVGGLARKNGASGPGSAGGAAPGALATDVAAGRAVLRDPLFSGRSDQLTPAGASRLGELARLLAADSASHVVEAHVDASGDAAADRLLAQQRARAAKAALVQAGVPAARLVALGAGASADGAHVVVARAQ